MWPNPQFYADLVAFTEEIFNGKLRVLYSDVSLLSKLKPCCPIPEAYLELSRTSTMELFCKKSYWVKPINYFLKKYLDIWVSSENERKWGIY